jgi:uncharacterized protein (TIGR04562 family)
MESGAERQELYHDIFGSVLDRSELTPYLLRNCDDYETALSRATLMMANRGFAIVDGDLAKGEKERAGAYVDSAIDYIVDALFPTVVAQLKSLAKLDSPQKQLYKSSIDRINEIKTLLVDSQLARLIESDPRNLFLLSSSAKYPHLFKGHEGCPDRVPPRWRLAGCTVLKMCHLIKAIEEDSQDIYDYARLGLFFESRHVPLTGLFDFPWEAPLVIPEDENARRAFVKLSTFFRKLRASITIDRKTGTMIFNSGDGIQVEIVEIKARLKSPESMFAKLGKDAAEEAYNIRDILAITFLLKNRDDSLTLFHALQKQGVILQETTASASITQTLFDTPADMQEAVRTLMLSLRKREGIRDDPTVEEVAKNSESFYRALSTNAEANPHSSEQHRKFQCKLNFSVPVRQDRITGHILVPGEKTAPVEDALTRQHTLPVELRISDVHSWEMSELRGEAHHSAYKFRQLICLMDRLFSPLFSFPETAFPQLRKDQGELFR